MNFDTFVHETRPRFIRMRTDYPWMGRRRTGTLRAVYQTRKYLTEGKRERSHTGAEHHAGSRCGLRYGYQECRRKPDIFADS